MKITKKIKDTFVLENGKSFDTFEAATIEAMKHKLSKLANDELFYDYAEIAKDFILDNQEVIYNILKTIKTMEEK